MESKKITRIPKMFINTAKTLSPPYAESLNDQFDLTDVSAESTNENLKYGLFKKTAPEIEYAEYWATVPLALIPVLDQLTGIQVKVSSTLVSELQQTGTISLIRQIERIEREHPSFKKRGELLRTIPPAAFAESFRMFTTLVVFQRLEKISQTQMTFFPDAAQFALAPIQTPRRDASSKAMSNIEAQFSASHI
jgi:hypothetical protein